MSATTEFAGIAKNKAGQGELHKQFNDGYLNFCKRHGLPLPKKYGRQFQKVNNEKEKTKKGS